jgi:hypothetical protein
MELPNKTALESLAGHPATVGAVAVAAGGLALAQPELAPIISMIPPLVQCLASERQVARIGHAIGDLNRRLEQIPQEVLKNISDEQYQFASEAVGHMLSTVKQEKLAYLQNAIVNNIEDASIAKESGEILSRLIRDISLGEVKALLHHFQFEGIFIAGETPESALPPNTYCVLVATGEARTIEGLIQLGLLQSHAPSWDMTRYQWNPIAAKLIALLRVPKKS